MAKKKKKPDDEDLPKKKKGKKASQDDDDDLDEVEEVDDDDDDDSPRSKKKGSDSPKDDAYTGLLAISMMAMIAICVLWFLDHSELSEQSLSQPSVTIPGLGAFSGAGAGNPAP